MHLKQTCIHLKHTDWLQNVDYTGKLYEWMNV